MDLPIAHTSLGDLRGARYNDIVAFRGVRYAEPPIAESRFAPCEPVRAWRGLRDATNHGPIAPQLPSRLSVAMGDFSRPQSEDCLTLTIYTPAADSKARPVLVWLHGGAWISGAGSLDWYDGSTLAREGDLVFVGVNYRLGALGWLHHPNIVPKEAGTSDMIAALAWIRDHIAAFGGDPARVTVMGQSAGATSIGRLLTLPEARPLFQRAIMQSGGFGRGAYTSAMAAERAEHFLRSLDIDPQASDAWARLQSVDIQRLLQAQVGLAKANARFAQTMPPFMPVVPTPMSQAEMLGKVADGAADKEILVGATADEVHAFFAADPALLSPSHEAMVARFGSEGALARYRARRPGASDMDLLADLGTDETFLLPAMRLAQQLAERGSKVFAYLFGWAPHGSRFKSCHCIELPFVFGNFSDWRDAEMLSGGDSAQMAELSFTMRRAWISFVRSGQPEDAAVPPWPNYDPIRQLTICFGSRVGVTGNPVWDRMR